MKVVCDCGFEESFDEAHLPPIIFCPYCGKPDLRFFDEPRGRRGVDWNRIRDLRLANWRNIFGQRGAGPPELRKRQ